jgi:hypothetical protein
VLDTRNAAGGPIGISPGHKLGAGETIDVAVAGVGAIPTEATSVAINVTIDEDATLKSFLTVWPTGQSRPNTSANNAEPGLVSPNSAIFQLGTGGKLSVFNQQGSVNVIMDVTGYFIAGEFVPTTTTTVAGGTTTTAAGTTTTTTAAPTLTVATGSFVEGNDVGFTGAGWTGCTSLTFEAVLQGTSTGIALTTTPASITPNGSGAITGTFAAPATGTYAINVAGTPSATCKASGTLTVG